MINLKEVDGVKIESKHIAQCHCDAVELELTLPDGLVDFDVVIVPCAVDVVLLLLRCPYQASVFVRVKMY